MKHAVRRCIRTSHAYKPSFGPYGERLSFVTGITGNPQAWTLESPGAWPRRLTYSERDITFAIWSHTDDQLIVGEDTPGGGTSYYLYTLSDNSMVTLVDEPDICWWGGWGPEGQRIAYASNRRRENAFDIFVLDVKTHETELVHESNGWCGVEDWAPTGDALLLKETHSEVEQDLYQLSLSDGTLTCLTTTTGPIRCDSPNWEHSTDSIYFVTDYDADTSYVAQLDVEQGDLKPVVSHDRWGIDGVNVHDETGRFVCGLNVDGYTDLLVGNITNPDAATRFESVDLPDGVMGEASFAPDGDRVALTVSSRTAGTNVHVVDLNTSQAEQWTRALPLGAPSRVAPEIVRYESFDGLEVPAFYSVPPDADRKRPLPAIMDIHGGPEDQRRPGFVDTIGCFLESGYAVFEPNIRGSTGYGAAYETLDDGRNRMDVVEDVRLGAEWLRSRPEIDENRIVIHGASYGGFVALLTAATYPKLWAAVVEVAGITDLVTFLENTGEWRRELREAEYGSLDEDREFLESISATRRAIEIEAPVLAIHGEKDRRVPLSETEQFVETARSAGVPVETLFLEEGHQLRSADARIEAYGAALDFLDRQINGESDD